MEDDVLLAMRPNNCCGSSWLKDDVDTLTPKHAMRKMGSTLWHICFFFSVSQMQTMKFPCFSPFVLFGVNRAGVKF